jgi:hypothetical protein
MECDGECELDSGKQEHVQVHDEQLATNLARVKSFDIRQPASRFPNALHRVCITMRVVSKTMQPPTSVDAAQMEGHAYAAN